MESAVSKNSEPPTDQMACVRQQVMLRVNAEDLKLTAIQKQKLEEEQQLQQKANLAEQKKQELIKQQERLGAAVQKENAGIKLISQAMPFRFKNERFAKMYDDGVTLLKSAIDFYNSVLISLDVVWFHKAIIFGVLQNHVDALACFDKVLEIQPNHIMAKIKKSVTLVKMGQIDKALELIKAIPKYPAKVMDYTVENRKALNERCQLNWHAAWILSKFKDNHAYQELALKKLSKMEMVERLIGLGDKEGYFIKSQMFLTQRDILYRLNRNEEAIKADEQEKIFRVKFQSTGGQPLSYLNAQCVASQKQQLPSSIKITARPAEEPVKPANRPDLLASQQFSQNKNNNYFGAHHPTKFSFPFPCTCYPCHPFPKKNLK